MLDKLYYVNQGKKDERTEGTQADKAERLVQTKSEFTGCEKISV